MTNKNEQRPNKNTRKIAGFFGRGGLMISCCGFLFSLLVKRIYEDQKNLYTERE